MKKIIPAVFHSNNLCLPGKEKSQPFCSTARSTFHKTHVSVWKRPLPVMSQRVFHLIPFQSYSPSQMLASLWFCPLPNIWKVQQNVDLCRKLETELNVLFTGDLQKVLFNYSIYNHPLGKTQIWKWEESRSLKYYPITDCYCLKLLQTAEYRRC